MSEFSHERLDVYSAAIDHLVLSDRLADALPKGRGYLADQLRRASLSICLNIAEGAGEFAHAEKARFFRMARRSGTECVAIEHACQVLGIVAAEDSARMRSLLDRVVAMLTGMVRREVEAEAEKRS